MKPSERYRNEEDPRLRLEALLLAKEISMNVILHSEERALLDRAFKEIEESLKNMQGFDKSGH